MILFALISCFYALAMGACTYTCWGTINPAANKFAACTGTNTINLNCAGRTFVQEDCGDCAYPTDRGKGLFRDCDTAWCWVALKDLSNETVCSAEDIEWFQSQKNIAISEKKNVGCMADGMYIPKTNATVRGDTSDPYGCKEHHFLGWIFHQDHFQVLGSCDSTCYWCYGHAYGDVNQSGSVICSELESSK